MHKVCKYLLTGVLIIYTVYFTFLLITIVNSLYDSSLSFRLVMIIVKVQSGVTFNSIMDSKMMFDRIESHPYIHMYVCT